ncbi:choice-of-anchor G family protein [Brevibacterium limosum]|uniref:choice-of-anchor G family protein n=1 Tax=Brevibacterium limosum TaxID=2697565 RepID=UPI00141DE127|nr:choice-of-anchor G family protein [Brevibacterium limosum]
MRKLRGRPGTSRKIAVGTVAAASALALTAMTVSPAAAAGRPDNGPQQDAEAWGQLIQSDLLGGQLADVASAYSSSPASTTAASTPLDIEALNLLRVDLGPGLTLPLVSGPGGVGLLDLGEVGALNAYGKAPAYNSAKASAGAVGEDGALNLDPGNPGDYGNAKVNLTDLLDQLDVAPLSDEIVDELSLELGALGSTAEAAGAGVTSEYVLADAKVNLTSPLVSGVSEDLDTALVGVGDTVDSAVATDGALGKIMSNLDLDAGIPGLGVNVTSGDIGVDGLDQALEDLSAELLKTPLEDGDPAVDGDEIVSIDLSTGKVTVNVANAAGDQGLNGLDPNTQLLDDTTLNNISAAITKALGTLTTKVTDGVTDVVNNTAVTLNLKAGLSASIFNTNADIKVETTLGQLAGTDTDSDPTVTVTTNSSGILDSILKFLGINLDELNAKLVNPLIDELVKALSSTLGGVIEGIGTDLSDNLDGIVEPVVTGLDGVLENLNLVADVTINEQPTKKEPAQESEVKGDNGPGFTVNAVSLELLNGLTTTQAPGDVADINLASSSVRATADAPAPGDDDANTNAAASASASADADGNNDPAAQAASEAAADNDADNTASAAADENAEAAAESAATEDASSEASADSTTDENASSTAASQAAAQADNTDDTNAEASTASDANSAAASEAASTADSSNEASAEAAAESDASAAADPDAANETDANANVNAAASASASANADDNGNAVAEAAAQAAADNDANNTASAAADENAEAAAESAANEEASSETSADATSDPNASAQKAANAAANADNSDSTNAQASAAANANAGAAASAASTADSSSEASANAAADGGEASASADGDEANASADGGAASASTDGDEANASNDSEKAASANSSASSDAASAANAGSAANASAGSSTNASGSSDGGDLPRTGADGIPAMVGFAALLLAGGAAAVWATRRYRAGKH